MDSRRRRESSPYSSRRDRDRVNSTATAQYRRRRSRSRSNSPSRSREGRGGGGGDYGRNSNWARSRPPPRTPLPSRCYPRPRQEMPRYSAEGRTSPKSTSRMGGQNQTSHRQRYSPPPPQEMNKRNSDDRVELKRRRSRSVSPVRKGSSIIERDRERVQVKDKVKVRERSSSSSSVSSSTSSSSSSTSDSDSSSSDSEADRKKKKKRSHSKKSKRKLRQKKLKRKLKKLKKIKKDKARRKSSPLQKHDKVSNNGRVVKGSLVASTPSSTTATTKMNPLASQKRLSSAPSKNEEATKTTSKRSIKPMTKEEWEKSQSVIRKVVSPTTGRTRWI